MVDVFCTHQLDALPFPVINNPFEIFTRPLARFVYSFTFKNGQGRPYHLEIVVKASSTLIDSLEEVSRNFKP